MLWAIGSACNSGAPPAFTPDAPAFATVTATPPGTPFAKFGRTGIDWCNEGRHDATHVCSYKENHFSDVGYYQVFVGFAQAPVKRGELDPMDAPAFWYAGCREDVTAPSIDAAAKLLGLPGPFTQTETVAATNASADDHAFAAARKLAVNIDLKYGMGAKYEPGREPGTRVETFAPSGIVSLMVLQAYADRDTTFASGPLVAGGDLEDHGQAVALRDPVSGLATSACGFYWTTPDKPLEPTDQQ